MSNRCEICGCITEEEMLRSYTLSGKQMKICSFCKKQLDAIDRDPQANAQQALNLLNMDTQGKRSAETQRLLSEHFESLEITGEKQSAESAPSQPLEKEVRELKQRIDSLESELNGFRRRYVITKILEIVIPIAFIVLMLIILVASGALKNLFGYYNTIMDYANM